MPKKEISINRGTEFGWTHGAAPYSHSYLSKPILEIIDNLNLQSIVDVGSGNGMFCAELRRINISAIGVEYDEEGYKVAKETHPNIPFYNLGVQDDPKPILSTHGHFDAVLSTEVIEHLFMPNQLFSFGNQLIKQGGYYIVSTPYHGFLKNLVLSIFNKWDHHFHPLKNGGHIKFFSRKTLEKIMEDNGLEVVKFEGAGRFPYLWKRMIIVGRKKSG